MNRLPALCTSITFVLTVCLTTSCEHSDTPTVKLWKSLNHTDTVGIESIAVKTDTITFKTDSLYDISLFGVNDSLYYGLTADNIIVIMDHTGRIISTSKRIGRGPGEFSNLAGISYDPFNNEIVLLDLWNKVIRLDAYGNFKGEIKNDITSTIGDIMPLSKDRYAATGISSNSNREYCITILDRDMNPVNHIMPVMNSAQKSDHGIIAIEYMKEYNSKVLYKPFSEFTYYELSDSSYTPYLTVDCGRYTLPHEMNVTVGDHVDKKNKFQIDFEAICGKYYFSQYLHEKDLCWYYDIFDFTTGRRVSHFRYGIEEYEKGTEEGFILRYGGRDYRIFPQYFKDNVLYWSRFNDNGTTTLFRVCL